MDVTCDHCKARLNVPDDKLLPGKKVTLVCPKCKAKLLVSRPPSKEVPAKKETLVKEEPPAKKDTSGQAPAESKASTDLKKDQGDEFLEFFGEDRSLALVIENNDDVAKKLQASVEEMGYKYVRAQNTREAIARMREYNFALITLSDRFDGIDLEYSPILEYLNHLPMSLRRRIFLILIGKGFKTMDLMAAFSMSANLVIGADDLVNMTRALNQSMADHKRFYGIFMEILAEVGKE